MYTIQYFKFYYLYKLILLSFLKVLIISTIIVIVQRPDLGNFELKIQNNECFNKLLCHYVMCS